MVVLANNVAPEKTPAWLIDSSIYVFKAWYTRPNELLDRDGNPVNAVIGFMDFVYKLLSNERPKLIAFAFDESLQTSHRKQIYPDYKANRASAPDSLRYQFRMCRKFIEILGIHQAASLHYEADDLIGTWAKSLRLGNIAVNIISADKDLAQLVHENDAWWEYDRGNKLDSKAITKKFRVNPSQIAEQIALAGDKSDNIPGIPGVGMTTAAKLLRKFESIDNLLSSIDEVGSMKIRSAKLVQDAINDNIQQIRISHLLTKIECNIEPIDNAIFNVGQLDKEAFEQLGDLLLLSNSQKEKWISLNLNNPC